MEQINFVIPAIDDDHLDYLKSVDLDKDYVEFNHSTKNWTLQCYLLLRDKLAEVTCSRLPKSNIINIGHCQYLRTIRHFSDCFIVSISGEYRHLLWANAHIVQNKHQDDGKRFFWIPHWGQPGLIPRDPDRTYVEHVAYAGRPTQLSSRSGMIRSKFARFGFFTSKNEGYDFWTEKLKKLGLRFSLLVKPHWNDMSNVDILLGIRSFDREKYNYLPPTKLLNAWNAGIPFIGGYDSAYEQVGTPGVDYIQVKTPDEAIEAIKKLSDDPDYYSSFVNAGYRKRKDYSREKIAKWWISLLTGPIRDLYNNWLNQSDIKNKIRVSFYSGAENTIRRIGSVLTLR